MHNKEKAELLSHDNFIGYLLTVNELIENNYAGEVDEQELIDSLIRGYLEGIGDQYSAYMNAEEYEAYKSEFAGNTVGIGINVLYDVANNVIEVIDVVPNSPAEKAGILNGDFLVAVNGTRIDEMGYYETLDLIRGEEGTEVVITVQRNAEEVDIICVRAAVEVVTVKYRVHSIDSNVGVITISSFYSKTPAELKAAVEALQNEGCTKFVFDIRNNGGGELGSIIYSLDYLLPEGKLADIYYKVTGKTKTYNSDEKFIDASVAVLVNENTASAAELFAAAMRDFTKEGKYDAVLVGMTTYGKGVFQTTFEMSDGSALKITCGRYDPPCGINYDGVGVTPDLIEDLSDEAKQIGLYKLTDLTDNQLALAVSKLSSK
jgi:carboxyl-terminal processing protease